MGRIVYEHPDGVRLPDWAERRLLRYMSETKVPMPFGPPATLESVLITQTARSPQEQAREMLNYCLTGGYFDPAKYTRVTDPNSTPKGLYSGGHGRAVMAEALRFIPGQEAQMRDAMAAKIDELKFGNHTDLTAKPWIATPTFDVAPSSVVPSVPTLGPPKMIVDGRVVAFTMIQDAFIKRVRQGQEETPKEVGEFEIPPSDRAFHIQFLPTGRDEVADETPPEVVEKILEDNAKVVAKKVASPVGKIAAAIGLLFLARWALKNG